MKLKDSFSMWPLRSKRGLGLPKAWKSKKRKLQEIDEEEVQLMPVDHITEFTDITGGNGRWQLWIFFVTTMLSLPASWNHLGMSFLAYPLDHWCKRTSNVSLEYWWAENLPNVTLHGKHHHSQCEMFSRNFMEPTVIREQTVPCDTWEYSNEYNSIVKQWNLVCDRAWMISTSMSVYMAGFLITVIVTGQLADTFGRFPAIMLNIVIALIGGVGAIFANSFLVFSIFRFLISFGHAGLGIAIFVLFLEVLGAQNRAKYSCLNGIGWVLGIIILPLLAWSVGDWFYLQIIITAPCLLFLLTYWALPESPRWLLSKGKLDKATSIIIHAAKMNRKEVTDIKAQVEELYHREVKEKQSHSTITLLDVIRRPNLRKRTFCLYFIWITIAFTYYGLSLNTNDLNGDAYINFAISGLVEIPAIVFCMFTLDRFGRKKTFTFTLLMGGAGCFGTIFIPERLEVVTTSLAMVGKFFVSSSFSIVYIYSSEIFPTVARNVGLGSCSMMARVGSIVSPFMKEVAAVTNPSVPLAIFGGLSIISGLLVFLLPETNGFPVPETIDDAENFGKKVKYTEKEMEDVTAHE